MTHSLAHDVSFYFFLGSMLVSKDNKFKGRISGIIIIISLTALVPLLHLRTWFQIVDRNEVILIKQSSDDEPEDGYAEMINEVRDSIKTYCPNTMFEEYANMHKAMDRKDFDSQRFTVFYSPDNGLGDRFTMAVTTFYTAVLSNRAFKMIYQNLHLSSLNQISFFDVFQSPWLNLSMNDNNTLTQRDLEYKVVDREGWRWGQTGIELYRYSNITSELRDYRIVKWRGNQGSLHSMIQNPFHSNWFKDQQLNGSNIFGCGIQYLFQLTRESFEVNNMPQLWKVFHKPEVLKIGIHIRVGDKAMKINHTKEWLDNIAAPFVTCAMQIESFNQNKLEYDSLLVSSWYVSSDNAQIVDYFHETYPNKTISVSGQNSTVEHLNVAGLNGFRTLAQEHVLFGLQDYVIVYDGSSFGMTAALRQLRSGGKHIYKIVRGAAPMDDPDPTKSQHPCGPNDYWKWDDMSTAWLGLRN